MKNLIFMKKNKIAMKKIKQGTVIERSGVGRELGKKRWDGQGKAFWEGGTASVGVEGPCDG